MTSSIWRFILQQPISFAMCVVSHLVEGVALPVRTKETVTYHKTVI